MNKTAGRQQAGNGGSFFQYLGDDMIWTIWHGFPPKTDQNPMKSIYRSFLISQFARSQTRWAVRPGRISMSTSPLISHLDLNTLSLCQKAKGEVNAESGTDHILLYLLSCGLHPCDGVALLKVQAGGLPEGPIFRDSAGDQCNRWPPPSGGSCIAHRFSQRAVCRESS